MKIDSFVDSVRVPLNSLEGIWKKASELLKTENAIVPAPVVGTNAKFVLSYRGNRPHLVVPKKGGSFVCDSDCPNWKALSICAHSVAVAEFCHKLPEFVEKFRKSKKSPNLTKFADATMPRGREMWLVVSERTVRPLTREWRIHLCHQVNKHQFGAATSTSQ